MVEIIDDIEIEVNNCYNITSDAILLADYVLDNCVLNNTMLEIGFGSGYISFKLKDKFKSIIAVDIQEKSYYNFLKNIEKNNIQNIKAIKDSVYNIEGKYDVIVSNPPFFKMNSGKLPTDEIKLISKFEKTLDMQKLIATIYRLLNDNGVFYLIYPKDRLSDFNKFIKQYNFKNIKIKEENKRIIIFGEK